MSHFKYEINERSLKMQLKENNVAFNEEAWLKFESFSATQVNVNHVNVIKRFQLSLNRNVILPVVFGGVVVLFSLLLFNFVNIKNPNQETAETKDVPPSAAAVVEKKIESVSVEKQLAPIIKDSVITRPSETVNSIEPEKIVKVVETKERESHSQKKSVVAVTSEQQLNSEMNRSTQAFNENYPPVKVEKRNKKRNKKQLILTEPSVEEQDQVPPPVSQPAVSSLDKIQ